MQRLGTVEKFIQHTRVSLETGTFVRIALSGPTDATVAPKILGRLVELRGGLQLSFTHKYATRDHTENVALDDLADWLQAQLTAKYRNALLGDIKRDWQFVRDANGKERLVGHKPLQQAPPNRSHDHKKTALLDASANDWLMGLEILDRTGKVRASMADKYRQINHYLELVSHLMRECGWDTMATPLRVADMGCGKGYLTFGLWHLLTRGWQRAVNITGVETREALVGKTNHLADRIGARGLQFAPGEIASVPLEALDGLIALHACNTATDDAIKRGVELGAKLIVVAPCCQQELRPQLGEPEPFAAVLTHGIMADRMAEWATDGLRALFLEWAGYRTKIMEFVGSEHTPKNVMIAAVRERAAFVDEGARQRILALKEFFQIKHHALDAWLESEK